jgi:hypothetical protein
MQRQGWRDVDPRIGNRAAGANLSRDHWAPERDGYRHADLRALAAAGRLANVELFKGFHREGRLIAPEVVASKLVTRLVLEEVAHGRTYSYQEL